MIAQPAPLTAAADGVLMQRVAAGDSRAFEVIYDRYHRRAYSYARSITGGDAGAEEATQDAFLALWRGAYGFDPERGSLAGWLFALVRHRSIDWLRRATARASEQAWQDGDAERIAAPVRTEEQVIAVQEFERALRLVAQLPPQQRQVIDLAYLAGYTQSEIAASVGLPLGTVKGRVRTALLKLRGAAELERGLPV